MRTWLQDVSLAGLSLNDSGNRNAPLFNIHTLTAMNANMNANANAGTAAMGHVPWVTLTSFTQVPVPDNFHEQEVEVNKDNLPLALSKYGERQIALHAMHLDKKRFGQMNPHLLPADHKFRHRDPIDHEYAEEQKPISKKALKGNRGAFLRSPECGLPEKDEDGFVVGKERDVGDGWGEKMAKQWNWAREDRYKGHGRTQ